MTYDEVVKYDVGLKAHPKYPNQQKVAAVKPLLKEVIDRAEEYSSKSNRALPFYNIETKSKRSTDNIYHPAPPEFVELLISVIKEKDIEQRVIIQSFDIRTLQYLHKTYPQIQTALLIEDRIPFTNHLDNLGFNPTIYSPSYNLVSAGLIKECHAKGIKVIPWTVNDVNTMKRLKKLGVDGLITDYPNLAF
jgi:glycerophosphoryl diester phosphodiesterase